MEFSFSDSSSDEENISNLSKKNDIEDSYSTQTPGDISSIDKCDFSNTNISGFQTFLNKTNQSTIKIDGKSFL